MAVTNLPCNVFNFCKTMLHVLSIGFQSSVVSLHILRTSIGCLCKQKFSSNYYLLFFHKQNYKFQYTVLKSSIVFKCIHGNGPQYLSELLCRRTTRPGLRSANSFKQYIPRTQSSAERSTADRAFSISEPKLWNQLPAFIQNSFSLDVFKSRLEKFLFKNFLFFLNT